MPWPRFRFAVRQLLIAVVTLAVFMGFLGWFFRSEPIELAPPSRWADSDHDLFDMVLSDISDHPGFGLGGRGRQIVVGDRTPGADGKGLLKDVLSDLILLDNRQFFTGGAFQIVIGDRTSGQDSQRMLMQVLENLFQIVIGDRTSGRDGQRMLKQVLENRDKFFPEEIKTDLMSRNSKGKKYSLARYQPSNPNILMQDPDSIMQDLDGIRDDSYKRRFPTARGYILPLLPGYSHDGRMASVLFICGPSLHGTLGYYLLRKVDGHWEITLRFVYGRPHQG